VVVAFLAAVTAAVLTGKSEAAVVVVGMAILGGLGLVSAQSAANREQTVAVKENTNGNHTRLLDMLERQGQLLAQMQPAQPIVVDGAVVGDPIPDSQPVG